MNITKQQLLLKYWLNNQFGGGYKWTTLLHHGVLFPSEYVPHGITLLYKGENIKLEPLQEEAAMLYAKYIGSDYVLNKTFNKNFWADWKKILGKNSQILSLEDCDFTQYHQKILDDKELKKQNKMNSESISSINVNSEIITIDSTDKIGDLEELNNQNMLSEISRLTSENIPESEKKYKIAIVDGKEQPVGNYRMEPPGIFLGRGDNPKIGKIKPRIYPEDITINIGKDSPIPELPYFLKNHKWGKIIHDRHVEWLASWKDTITGKTKYLWLGSHSDFKASSDREKFDLARKLKRKIDTIHQENERNLFSGDIRLKQVATAFYFIDKYALRVGNEKGESETDTQGVTSLRVEHIELLDNNIIVLDFLGKDSVPYHAKLSVEPIIYQNIKQFIENKEKEDQIFDKITSADVNKYLQTFMKDLTAKVFRTYNASNLFQKELRKINKKHQGITDVSILLDEFNKANAKVAQQLNHQKNVGKSHKGQLDKIDIMIKKVKLILRKTKSSNGKNKTEKIEKIRIKLKKLKSKKELKQELKNISLGTSKTNYLDPRITVSFLKLHNLPVDKVFSKVLQQKFQWAFEVDENFKF